MTDDGANEIAIALSASSGPAALEIVSESPISTVQLRLLEGNFRLHGLAYPNNPKAAIQIDLFGFPGATVSGWERANNDYISSWFAENKYDLVMLEFGTNEGNAKPFKAGNYEQSLRNAMKNFRGIFPLATCVLVGPGDRGQLVRRIGKARKQSGELTNNVSRFPSKVGSSQNKSPEGGLLRFGQIHQEIGRIQTKVAKEYGCRAWSMLNAMGGVGSAYQWAQQKPPLMARDLIHFTTLGYQRIAQIFAKDLGWSAAKLLSVNGGSGYER